MFRVPLNIFDNCLDNDFVAFFHGGKKIKFSEFAIDVARYARLFSKINSTDVVLFIPENIYLFYVCFMALLQSGHDIILPASLTVQNIPGLLEKTNILVTDLTKTIDGFEIVDLDKVDENVGANFNFVSMDNRILYFFTSGSTGTPKCIRKTFNMISAEIQMHNSMHDDILTQSPVFVASVMPYHMYGLLWQFLLPLASGCSADLDVIFTPEEVQAKQAIYEKIVFITTPSFLDSITRYNGQYSFANNCIYILSSGSLLRPETSQSAMNMFGVSPFEVFGSTETGGVASRQQINGPFWHVFKPVNAHVDEMGRIVVASDFCCSVPYQMSDGVEFIDNKTFLLKGRADRLVKIAEERVSLIEVESAVEAFEFVSCCYVCAMDWNNRTILGCVLTLTDKGKDFIVLHGRHEFITQLKKHLGQYFKPVIIPRKFRIVNNLPMNRQGKIQRDSVMCLLSSNVVEPIMQNIEKTDKFLSADLTFLGTSDYFKGHFDGYPILPGVVQMLFVTRFIKDFFNTDIKKYEISKLKYSSLILPDTKIHFELKRVSDTEFTFEYANGEKKCSSGKLVIKE